MSGQFSVIGRCPALSGKDRPGDGCESKFTPQDSRVCLKAGGHRWDDDEVGQCGGKFSPNLRALSRVVKPLAKG